MRTPFLLGATLAIVACNAKPKLAPLGVRPDGRLELETPAWGTVVLRR